MSVKLLPAKAKLKVIQRKLEEIEVLLDGSEYERYISNNLITIKYEIERQLSLHE